MENNREHSPLVLVLSAPSGAGKTTLASRLAQSDPNVHVSVSTTTRPRRKGERDGLDYHFVDEETFQDMVRQNAFVEWAKVHGHFYGSGSRWVRRQQDLGRDVLFILDVQGAMQVRQRLPNALLVFIVPPSLAELQTRLRRRGTDRPQGIAERLRNAVREIQVGLQHYDHVIVNDRLDEAVDDLRAIVRAHRLRQLDRRELGRRLLGNALA
ncbi:MAG: guanylate kinase [Myxococcota bacterium]